MSNPGDDPQTLDDAQNRELETPTKISVDGTKNQRDDREE